MVLSQIHHSRKTQNKDDRSLTANRRQVTAILWGLVILGLVASLSIAAFVAWNQERINATQEQLWNLEKELNIDLEKLRRLTLESHFKALETLNRDYTGPVPSPVNLFTPDNPSLPLLVLTSEQLPEKYPALELKVAIDSQIRRSDSLQRLWTKVQNWRRTFFTVEKDVLHQLTLDRTREALAATREQANILQGRLDLAAAQLRHQARLAAPPRDNPYQRQLQQLREGPWPRHILEFDRELDKLSVLLERIGNTKRKSRLLDLRVNHLLPISQRMQQILALLEASPPPIEDPQLPEVQPLLDNLYGKNGFTVIPGSSENGLLPLMGLYIDNRIHREQLVREVNEHLDQSNLTIAFFDQLSGNYLSHQHQQNQTLMRQALTRSLTILSTVLLGFIFLAWLMLGQIRRHFTQLARLKRRNELILNSAGEGIIGVDDNGLCRFINPAAAHMLKTSEQAQIGRPIDAIWDAEGGSPSPIHQVLTSDEAALHTQEARFRRTDGESFPVEYTIMPISGQQDSSGAVLTFMDITSSKQAQTDLENSERQFRILSEKSLIGVYIIQHGHFTYVNPRLAEIFGYSRDEIEHLLSPRDLVHPADRELVEARIRERLSGETGALNYSFRGLTKEGEQIVVEVYGSLAMHNGQPCIMGTLLDITERTRSAEKIKYQAYYDQLTGLPNRALFLDRLQQAIHTARRNHSRIALLFLDLDRFKHINDSLGHPVGDALLSSVAGRLNNTVRENDTVARLGGDEFTIILENIHSSHQPATVASKVLDQLNGAFQLSGHDLYISASIGICLYPEDGTEVDDLVRNADAAMYLAKQQGRGTYSFYTSQLTLNSSEWLELETDLRKAIQGGQLALVYQPQVDLHSGRTVAVECLLRWQHPEKGTIPPDRFIPLAEETNLILEIGDWVLHEGCRQMQAWHAQGFELTRLAVNISAVQLERCDLFTTVADILAETGLPANMLELEITENSIMQHPEQCIAVLRQLEDLGVSLSIDDFGSGYSSLSLLKRLPIHKLKIDRSFICDISDAPDNAAIAMAIINMGRLLQLEIVAEGVETAQQRDFVADNGCHLAQGYLFAEPLSADQFAQRLAAAPCVRPVQR